MAQKAKPTEGTPPCLFAELTGPREIDLSSLVGGSHLDQSAGTTQIAGDSYVCPQCGRRYKVVSTLKRHMRFECGVERQFVCFFCGGKFKRPDQLRLHINLKHGMKT